MKEIFIKKGDKAVILIHGFTGSVQEMENLAYFLAKHNFTVIVPLLKGHYSTEKEFSKTCSEDYYNSVLNAYDKVKNYKSIDVIGLSFGSILALNLAIEKKIRKIVVLAPAIKFNNPLVPFVGFFKYILKKHKKQKTKIPNTNIYTIWDVFKLSAINKRKAYDYVLLKQLHSIYLFIQKVKSKFNLINQPILIMHSKLDKVVNISGAKYLFNNVNSKEKKLIVLKKSNHVITQDYDHLIVKKEVLKFL
jgi:carboxylesterase